METKQCSHCREFKSLDNFGKHKRYKDGLQYFCKECKKISDKEYRKNNHEKVLQMKKTYRENNPEKVRLQKRRCYLNKREQYLKRNLKNYKHRYQNDNDFRILVCLRSRIGLALRGKSKSDNTMRLIGCSLNFLKNHLQETADNNGYKDFDINTYSGKDFHIDHIIPCSSFDLIKEEEQKKCFHWSNLQILKAEENLIKNDRRIKNG